MGFFLNDESIERILCGVTNGIHDNEYHPIASTSAEIST